VASALVRAASAGSICPRTAYALWRQLTAKVELPKGAWYGWHLLRRQWATEMKHTPLRDLTYMGGWKSAATVLACYQIPDEATQREALR